MESTVEHLMCRELICVNEQDPLSHAYRLMTENHIRHLPVQDEDGEFVGILSHRDIMRAAESQMSYEYGFFFENLKLANHLLVEDYMTSPVETLATDEPLKLAAQKMVDSKISSFLVTENDEVVGIVTTDDLLKYLVFVLDRTPDDWQVNLKTLFTNPFARFAQTANG